MTCAKSWTSVFALAVSFVVLQWAPVWASVPPLNWPVSLHDTYPAAFAVGSPSAHDNSIIARATVAPGSANLGERGADRKTINFLTRRHRQYEELFTAGGGVILIVIIAALSLRHRRVLGVGLAALGALGIGALLQFSAASGVTDLMWPSPYRWLGTFAGTFMLAVMLAAAAAVLIRPGWMRGVVVILIAEGVWWSVTLPSRNMDWLIFLGTAAGAFAAPVAAWALAALCSLLAERIVPART